MGTPNPIQVQGLLSGYRVCTRSSPSEGLSQVTTASSRALFASLERAWPPRGADSVLK